MDYLKKAIWGPDPKEQMRKCNSLLRKNKRQLDRSINNLSPLQKKTESLIRQSAKKNDLKSARIYAKELINIKNQKNRLYKSKAQLDSITMKINENFSILKLQGKIGESAIIMREVNSLVRLPELTATMRELEKELVKSGVINEMIEDRVDSFEVDFEEEEIDEQIDQIISELTSGQLDKVNNTPTHALEEVNNEIINQVEQQQPLQKVKSPELVAEGGVGDDSDEILKQMRERLKALQD
ncbi:ESCRT-III subunit protein VPS24 [Ascoidea rubescens DSM 1968]|uniref:Snf7-domain-containing protein n=1 Tax=Ascoidea rubescens DSM 1968 TaxID=1344418 RepID=A0A1D2VAP0_9ASCO|nr:Snf7-domain-containing protein [Ascoidea rubescens DSM 1968]ODV58690.1 Snf7-domain-containing protein [Ascoidea rubescens DSM 1968]